MKIGLDFLLGFALDWIGYGLDTIVTSPNFFQNTGFIFDPFLRDDVCTLLRVSIVSDSMMLGLRHIALLLLGLR